MQVSSGTWMACVPRSWGRWRAQGWADASAVEERRAFAGNTRGSPYGVTSRKRSERPCRGLEVIGSASVLAVRVIQRLPFKRMLFRATMLAIGALLLAEPFNTFEKCGSPSSQPALRSTRRPPRQESTARRCEVGSIVLPSRQFLLALREFCSLENRNHGMGLHSLFSPSRCFSVFRSSSASCSPY